MSYYNKCVKINNILLNILNSNLNKFHITLPNVAKCANKLAVSPNVQFIATICLTFCYMHNALLFY